MNKETTNLSLPCNYSWLDTAENDLLGAFEGLHGVFFRIIEEYLKSSILNHADSCCSCKGNTKPSELDFTKESKRYNMKFSSTVETWKDKFFKLRKKYRKLKRDSYQMKEQLSPGSRENMSGESREEQNYSAGSKANVSNDKKEKLQYSRDDSKEESVRTLSKDKLLDVFIVDDEQYVEPEIPKDCAIILENSKANLPDSPLNQSTSSKHEQCDKRLGNENHLDPSWKRADLPPLCGRSSGKIKYVEKSNKLTVSKSINEFFKPHAISKIRSISSRRSKRQIMNSSTELPRMKRPKEGSKWLKSERDDSLMLIESTESNCLDRTGEFKIEKKNHKTQINTNDFADHENSANKAPGISGDSERTEMTSGKENIASKPVDVLAPCNNSRHKKKHSNGGDTNGPGHTVSFNGTVGLPSFASTPMAPVESGQNCYPGARDFDDTMWSAPESPSVVRSIFSTPEMTDIEKSNENDQGEIEHHDEDFKAPRTDGKPLLLKESQSFISKVAKDSTHTSGQKNVTYKTTDGDLSADMFFGCTGNIENTQEENIEAKYNASKREVDEQNAVKEKERVIEPNLDDNTCFERPKFDVKYKFNAVVRKRDERDKLDGYACAECAAWYEDEVNSEEKRKHLRNVCRHKAVSSPPPSTPDGFWSIRFPDTPVYMKKGLMLNEDDTLPLHERPRKRKDRTGKIRDEEIQETDLV